LTTPGGGGVGGGIGGGEDDQLERIVGVPR